MYHLTILLPDKVAFDGEVEALIIPGGDGYLELLTHHAPILTSIKEGKVIVTKTDKQKLFYNITSGFFEMHSNDAALLADAIEPCAGFDLGLTNLT